jgi:hypothetical protein
MPSKYRWSAVNAVLAALATASAAGVIALFPGVPVFVRVLAVLGVLGVFAATALVSRWALSRDRARIALFAAVRGWDYRARDDDLPARFSVFPFTPGRGGTAVNVLEGPHRFHDCATFTFVVRKPAVQLYQVTLIELGASPPSLELLPEDLVAAITKVVGGQDLTVGNPNFDDHWRIVSRDAAFVRRVLNPQLQRRLARRDTRGMPVAIDGGAVLTWQAGPIGVRRLSRRLDALIDVVEAIPEEVWTSPSRPSRE